MRKVFSWKGFKELVESGEISLEKNHPDLVDVYTLSNRGHEVGVSILTPGVDREGRPVLRTGVASWTKNLIECEPRQKVCVTYNTGPSGGIGHAIVLVKSIKFEVYFPAHKAHLAGEEAK